MNIPNMLSALRIALIPVFGVVYMSASEQPWFYAAALILLFSALTDILDGVIARRCNMITPLGKILDPFADKLTQAVVCILFSLRNPEFWFVVVIIFVKELLMLAAGLKLYHLYKELSNSKWFGKLYTVVFYVIMLLIIAFPNLKAALTTGLLAVMVCFMLFAFFMYIPVFLRLMRKK